MTVSPLRRRQKGRSAPAKPARRRRPPPAKVRAKNAPKRARASSRVDTRAQLIDAGLEAFGRLGYEGASTREIARTADANLAAIVYHFGGKEGLHLAVAEHIAVSIAQKMGPTLASVMGIDASATQEAAQAALHKLVAAFIDVILGAAEAERWARYIVREQMQPTAAFDVIYRFLGGAVTTATRLAAVALARPEDDETRLRVFTMLGQVLIFRVAQTLVFRRMDWTTIGDTERAFIKRLVLEQIDDILDAARKPGGKS